MFDRTENFEGRPEKGVCFPEYEGSFKGLSDVLYFQYFVLLGLYHLYRLMAQKGCS